MSWNDVRRQNEALSDALTFKQYKKISGFSNYRERFTAALRVSKSRRIQRLCEHGLDLCNRAERVDEIQAQAAELEERAPRLIWHGHLALVVNC